MAKITFDQSTREHLAIWQMMRAVDDTGSDRTAWGCRRVISMTSPLVPENLLVRGTIRSLEHDLEAVYAKPTAIDRRGDKHLVRSCPCSKDHRSRPTAVSGYLCRSALTLARCRGSNNPGRRSGGVARGRTVRRAERA
jgi:hypothetical protein